MKEAYLIVYRTLHSFFLKSNRQESANDLINRFFRLMNQEKLYLQPTFSLESLAHRLDVSVGLLSEVIFENLDQNFLELVAHYRIQEAKKMLENPKNAEMSLETLAFEVGYNSSFTFNDAFKKHTLLTPFEYRKQMNLICA
jgi:AraC-like DNA-binding protein